jgi:hypothetical protein
VVTEYQGNLSYTQGSNGLIYKCLQTHIGLDPTNTNNNLFWVRAFEEYGAVQTVQTALNTHLANYATLSGIANVVLARANLSVYSKAEGDSRYAYKGGDNSTPFLVGTATNPFHAVPLGQIGSLLSPATDSTFGTTRYSTVLETEQGTLNTRSITPLVADSVFLKKSGNLAGLANQASARTNLGLGTISTRNSTEFLETANNLSDLGSVSTARTNLGLTSTATQPESYFLRTANNLSDVVAGTARTNLGLTTLATTNPTTVVFKSDNLAGLTNVPLARINLGLGTAALSNAGAFLQTASNLADLSNVQTARNNLGLGSASTRNVVGVPGALDFTALFGQTGYQRLPSGMIEQWGIASLNGGGNDLNVFFPIPFPGQCFNIQLTNYEDYPNEGNTVRVRLFNQTYFQLSNGGGNTATFYMWRAIGA